MPISPRELPLLKLAIAIAGGIFFQEQVQLEFTSLLLGFLLSFIALLFLHQKRTLGFLHYLRTGVIYITFLSLGAALFQLNLNSIRNTDIDKLMYEEIEGLVTCTSIPKHNRMIRFEGKITHIKTKKDVEFSRIKPVKVLVHVKDSAYSIHNGDRTRIRGIFKNTSKSNSPHVFDYSRYLKFRHIAYQTYVDTDDILLWEEKEEPWYSEVRWWGINKFKKHLSPQNVAIASALVLGHRGLIGDDMYEAFAQTGSMHVLAVSGLHVGILSMLLGIFLSFIRSNKRNAKILKSIVLLAGIWSFAFITGGSPSVLRASLMFSVLEVGKVWQGHYSVYNSIGAAALLLLCYDPFLLFHVGFQLSFAAIISIVMFCGKISRLVAVKNPIGNYLWKLMSVALSVQILTLPISLYYFHQFPVYFPITGITAVVLAIGILSSGLVLLFLSVFLANDTLWVMYDQLVSLLADSTYAIHSMPYGLIPNIEFDQIAVMLLFVSIGLISYSIFYARSRFTFLGLMMLLTMFGYREYQQYKEMKKPEIVFYDTRKPLVDIIIDGKVYSYADPKLTDKNRSFATRNYRIHKRADSMKQFSSLKELRTFYSLNIDILEKIKEIDASEVFKRSDLIEKDIAMR